VDHLRYEPVSPWPVGADSGGRSLERVTLEGYGNDPDNWLASMPGGTPGTFDGNRPPEVLVMGETTVAEGGTVWLTIEASDPDEPWQTVNLSAGNLPSGSAFNPATGEFFWSPGESDGPGVYNPRFIATDSGLIPSTSTQTVAIVVEEVIEPGFHLEWNHTGGGGLPQFSFITIAGDAYEIYCTDQLNPPDWQLVERITNASAGVQIIPGPPDSNAPQQFLRVLWVPQP
jgi:hypothetical protein